jgi:hypothetical protein
MKIKYLKVFLSRTFIRSINGQVIKMQNHSYSGFPTLPMNMTAPVEFSLIR